MAAELGLGITPWSPLKSGLLSGKFNRANGGKVDGARGAFVATDRNEHTWTVVEALEGVARAHDTTVARAALAWVRQQPGVTSTIIGARRITQLDDNLASLDVTLTAAELAALDAITKPTFGFPQSMEPMFPAIHNGGTTVNGTYADPSPFVMLRGGQPY